MRLHHVLVDTTSALQCCQASETSNRVQIVSKDLHTVILSLLRSAKCENYTFHAFTSLLPSAPVCQTLQMSPRTLQNMQSEIATNLRLTAMEPSSASGSDGNASFSGVVKVLQRLMRKLSSSRNMYSAKPPKHTVYLFSCGPDSEKEIPVNTHVAVDTAIEKSASQSSNAWLETLGKLKGFNMHLVWIFLESPYQLHTPTISVSARKNPLHAWAQNNTHLEIKYFADLLDPRQPARRPLAFSLQKRLGIASQAPERQKANVADREKARIVVEQRDEQDERMLLCISNVKVLSLQRSTQNAERETAFVLSHYLKKWQSPSSEKAFADTKPRTLKARGADDSEAFSYFMSFLMRTETIVVANELTVDDKKQTVQSRPVMIVPYTSSIASVCNIPFAIKPRRSQGSPLPKNYRQWQDWHSGGQSKRLNSDKSDEVYGTLLSTDSPGNAWQDFPNPNDVGNLLSLKHDTVRNRKLHRQGDPEMESSTEVRLAPNVQKPLSAGKIITHAKEPSLKKRGRLRSPDVPVVSKIPGNMVSKGKPRVPVTVTKNGFRYKRVSVENAHLRQSLNVSVKESIIPEPSNKHSRTSQPQKPLISKSSIAAQKQCVMRYKGDGKKRISVDTAILCGEKEELFLGKLRVIKSCEPNGPSRTSSAGSTGYLPARGTPEVKAVRLEDGVEATFEVDSNRSSPADENNSCVLPSTDTLTNAIGQFDNAIAGLLNPSIKDWEPIVRNALTQLSSLSEQLVTTPHSWPELHSLAKWRLRDVNSIIASLQAGHKTFSPDEPPQSKAINGLLWKSVIEAFEQVVWLLMRLTDPKAKISSNPKKKPECFRRATTILSCAQVTAELNSSVFGSSQYFRSVWDSFFNSTLLHLLQASDHVNLMHWTRVVFEHFEKDVSCGNSAANPQSMKRAPDDASSSSLSRRKDMLRTQKNLKRSSRGHCHNFNANASTGNLSHLLPERKGTVRKPESLRNHPAFRRGKAFAGVSKQKRRPSRVQQMSKHPCSSDMLDKLIHMGSLQSSLDAIKVPEAKDHDFCDEAVEATDDETDKTLAAVTKKSSYRRSEGNEATSDAHDNSRQAIQKVATPYSSVNLRTEVSLDTGNKPYKDKKTPSERATNLILTPNSTCVDGDERPKSKNESIKLHEKAKNERGQYCPEKAERSISVLNGSPVSDPELRRSGEVLALRNRKVKRQEQGPEVSHGDTSTTERGSETHQNSHEHISRVHDVSNSEPVKDANLNPVKKRKLALRDDLRPEDQSLNGIVGEPKSKRPHRFFEGPKPSLFNRIRKLFP